VHKDQNPNTFIETHITLEPEEVDHSRRIYGLLDFFGDLGGVLEIIMVSFGFFLFPISEHSFYMEVIKNLFFARSKHGENLFIESQKEDKDRLEKFCVANN